MSSHMQVILNISSLTHMQGCIFFHSSGLFVRIQSSRKHILVHGYSHHDSYTTVKESTLNTGQLLYVIFSLKVVVWLMSQCILFLILDLPLNPCRLS